MRTAALAALVLAATATTAAAQAPGQTPVLDDDEPTAPVARPVHEKSPELATALSIGTTGLGYLMMAKADGNGDVAMTGALLAMFGPSTGQWYAGKVGGAGIGMRAISLGIMIYGVAHMSVADCFDCSIGRDTENEAARGRDYLIAGAALWVGSTIYDFVQAYRETDHYNQRQRALVMPTVLTAPASNAATPGFAVAMRF